MSADRRLLVAALVAATLCAVGGCNAPPTAPAEIEVAAAWARATPPGAEAAAVYLTLTNRGSTEDRLLAARSPAAQQGQVHESRVGADGVVQMRPLDAVLLPVGTTVAFVPMGRHIMLTGLASPLLSGTSFDLVLEFERAPAQTVQVRVEAVAAVERGPQEQGHEHHAAQ